MDEHDLAEVVAAAYEAATGGSWIDCGRLLGRFVGAQSLSMRLLGDSPNLIAPPQSSMEQAYLDYYRHIDPYRSRAVVVAPTLRRSDQPCLGQEFLPTDEFRRSEYYNDYVRPHGQHHMLAAILKLSEPMTLGLHRNDAAGPFSEAERAGPFACAPSMKCPTTPRWPCSCRRCWRVSRRRRPILSIRARPGGVAMVLARQLRRPAQIAPDLLCDLYGLTRAEASVAASLVGGVTAEDVARTRHVSLGTIWTQVRTVLRKTNAANLRDFERILALVSAA